VPQPMHNELKEKILQKIVEFGGDGTKLVLNRLCMSVSHLCLLYMATIVKKISFDVLAQRIHSAHAQRVAVSYQ